MRYYSCIPVFLYFYPVVFLYSCIFMTERMPKINGLIKQELAKLINEEMEFAPGVLATVLAVKTSRDLKHARVAVSVLPFSEAETIIRRLNNFSRRLQQLLNDKVSLRSIPRLFFILDDSEEQASQIDKLLDNLS